MENKYINELVEPNIRKKNYYQTGTEKHLFENGDFRYIVTFVNRFFKTQRKFEDLESAQSYKRICLEHLNKAKFQTTPSLDFSDVDIQFEYPDTLLKTLDITPELPNYYTEIVPNFERNYARANVDLIPKESECIDLYFRQYKSLLEIGKIKGLTQERVRQIIHRGVAKLRHKRDILLGKDKTIYDLLNERELQEIKDKVYAEMSLEYAIELVKQSGYNVIEIPSGYEGKQISLDTNIRDLDLSCRSYNCLARARYETVGDIISGGSKKLMKVRNLGRKSFKEITRKIKEEFGIEIV